MRIFAALWLLASASLAAQSSRVPLPAPRAETRHLTVTTSTSVATEGRDAAVSLFVDITPKPAMHVYAPGEKDVIPVSLTLAPHDAVVVRRPPVLPTPERYHFAPLGLTQLVFSRPFRITQPITLASTAAGSRADAPLVITGTLRYQACDDKLCYAPVTVPLSWRVGGGADS